MKVNTRKKSQVATDVAEEVVEEAAQETSEEATEVVEEAAEPDTTPEPPPVAQISQAKPSGTVKIAFLRDIAPPPTVGNFDFARVFGITKVTQRNTFSVPLSVAQTLQDSGAVIIAD